MIVLLFKLDDNDVSDVPTDQAIKKLYQTLLPKEKGYFTNSKRRWTFLKSTF